MEDGLITLVEEECSWAPLIVHYRLEFSIMRGQIFGAESTMNTPVFVAK